jgi:hypothetical protein
MRLLERGIWGGFEVKWLKSKLVRSRNSRIAVPFTTSKSDSRQRFRLLIHSGRQADGAWISMNDPRQTMTFFTGAAEHFNGIAKCRVPPVGT